MPYIRYFMIRWSNQNSTFPKVTCCTKRAKYRCCILVSNTHVLYDAPYAHTYTSARARQCTHTYPDSFLVRQKFIKSRKKDNSLQRNIFIADKLTKKKKHFITICAFCQVLLNKTCWLPAEYQGQVGRKLAETAFPTFSPLNILCFIGFVFWSVLFTFRILNQAAPTTQIPW